MIPSTAKGKKAKTHFQRINESPSGWSLWKASTRFPRFHQIRAHAAVEGIPILGDAVYSGPRMLLLSELMAGKQIAEMNHPIFSGCIPIMPITTIGQLRSSPRTIRALADLKRSFSWSRGKARIRALSLNRASIVCSASHRPNHPGASIPPQ